MFMIVESWISVWSFWFSFFFFCWIKGTLTARIKITIIKYISVPADAAFGTMCWGCCDGPPLGWRKCCSRTGVAAMPKLSSRHATQVSRARREARASSDSALLRTTVTKVRPNSEAIDGVRRKLVRSRVVLMAGCWDSTRSSVRRPEKRKAIRRIRESSPPEEWMRKEMRKMGC